MRLLSLIVAVAVCRVSYASGSSIRESSWNETTDRNLPFLAYTSNLFALRFHERFARADTPNVVFASSDLFASYWAMTHGLPRDRKNDFDAVFPPPFFTKSNIEDGLRALRTKVGRHDGFDLNSTSKIYHGSSASVNEAFNEAASRVFLENATTLDFHKKTEAAATINEWFARATNKRRSKIVIPGDFGDNVSLVVVSSVSFKGRWARPFASIPNQSFRVDESKNVSVPFMKQLDFLAYGELPEVRAKFVGIEYEKTGDPNSGMSLFIVIPNEIDGLSYLEENMRKINVRQLLAGKLTEMILTMPKLRIRNQILVERIVERNVSDSKLTTEMEVPGGTIRKIIQDIKFQIDETCDSALINASAPKGIMHFDVNRPFVIVVATTGRNPLILFTARYKGPFEQAHH